MSNKFIRDSANEHLLPRLLETDIYASRWLPIDDRRRRAPRPAAPIIIQLVLRKINADAGAFSNEQQAGHPILVDVSRRH
jgi:hypothetical protein